MDVVVPRSFRRDPARRPLLKAVCREEFFGRRLSLENAHSSVILPRIVVVHRSIGFLRYIRPLVWNRL